MTHIIGSAVKILRNYSKHGLKAGDVDYVGSIGTYHDTDEREKGVRHVVGLMNARILIPVSDCVLQSHIVPRVKKYTFVDPG